MAPAAEQQTVQPIVGFEQQGYAPQQQSVQPDGVALAGSQFDLPMDSGKYSKKVDTTMPLVLQNVMTPEEYREQVQEINDLLERTSEPYVRFIPTFQTIYVVVLVVMIALFIGAFIGAFFTMGITIVALFIVWIPATIGIIGGTFYARYAIAEKKKKGDEQSRLGLATISEKWLPRGIAWRQKEGEAVFAQLTAGRRRLSWITIRPLMITIELAPNAASLFRTMGPFQSTRTETVLDMETPETDGLLNEPSGLEMQYIGTAQPQDYSQPRDYTQQFAQEPLPYSQQDYSLPNQQVQSPDSFV